MTYWYREIFQALVKARVKNLRKNNGLRVKDRAPFWPQVELKRVQKALIIQHVKQKTPQGLI